MLRVPWKLQWSQGPHCRKSYNEYEPHEDYGVHDSYRGHDGHCGHKSHKDYGKSKSAGQTEFTKIGALRLVAQKLAYLHLDRWRTYILEEISWVGAPLED